MCTFVTLFVIAHLLCGAFIIFIHFYIVRYFVYIQVLNLVLSLILNAVLFIF